MAEVQTQPAALSMTTDRRADEPHATPISVPQQPASRLSRITVDTYSPVNQNGSFEFDRVLKSGYVQKRTQKTKTWRTIYIVLRPNALSIYKTDKEEKLRRKVYMSDLTAVTMLKDPKNKRPNVFGIFSPAKNYHFQASTPQDAQDWVDLIRREARIEEEEEEMFLASPVVQQPSFGTQTNSAEPYARRQSQIDSSGLSGAELASPSDFSDTDMQRIKGTSFESLGLQQPVTSPGTSRPSLGALNASQGSGIHPESDPDRVIWQGWMWIHRSKGAMRQWKKSWGVVRPRNLILYKDDAESSVLFILYMSSIVNVVETDPKSRTKKHCLQIITDEKSYRFCTKDEEALVQCLGAFKSLLAKRRELEAKVGTSNTTAISPVMTAMAPAANEVRAAAAA
ncbi:hypothetical protein N0V88_005775 [Collariella sp. IMI 366227]|nr:hypothetical protein N0V88_005775 [Collariella sp. IMI 366227]